MNKPDDLRVGDIFAWFTESNRRVGGLVMIVGFKDALPLGRDYWFDIGRLEFGNHRISDDVWGRWIARRATLDEIEQMEKALAVSSVIS